MKRSRWVPLVLALLITASLPVPSAEPSTVRRISLSAIRNLVFTPESQHAFITGGTGNDELFEVDRDARVVRRKEGLGGAGDMIFEGGSIYLALEDEGAIVELERSTLKEIARYETDPYAKLGWISKAGDDIYFTYKCWGGDYPGVAAVNLATGIVRDTSIPADPYCVDHEAVGSDSQLLVWGGRAIQLYALDPVVPVLLREREVSYFHDGVTDGRFLYLLTTRLLEKIDIQTLETVAQESLPEGGTTLSLTPDGRDLAVVGPAFGEVRVFRTASLEQIRRFGAGFNPGTEVAVFEGARKLMYASNYYDATARVGTLFDLEEVAATRRMELDPSAGAGYVAWASGSPARPRWENIYLEAPGGKISRLRTPGAEAFPGAIDEGKLIHQQVNGRRSDLYLYDIGTRKTDRLPAAINSRAWEWRPSMSGRWVLFSRMPKGGVGRIVLFDNKTNKSKVLYRAPGRRVIPLADQVNGNHAVWTVCSRVCSVFRHDIARRQTKRLPNRWPLQFSATVDKDGTMYYAKAGRGCGNHAGIVRHETGEEPRLIFNAYEGYDIDRVHLEPGSNPRRVYFTRYYCNDIPLDTDILFFEDP